MRKNNIGSVSYNVSTTKKRALFTISLIVFLLTLCSTFLYFVAISMSKNSGVFDFNNVIKTIQEFFGGLDYNLFSTYLLLTIYVLPLVGGILGLLNKPFRLFGVLALLCIFGSLMFNLCNFSGNVFNFSDFDNSIYSSIFIVNLVAFVLTFINVEKSK